LILLNTMSTCKYFQVPVDPQVLKNPRVFDSRLWVTWWLKPAWIQVWLFEFEILVGTDPGHPRVHLCSPLHWWQHYFWQKLCGGLRLFGYGTSTCPCHTRAFPLNMRITAILQLLMLWKITTINICNFHQGTSILAMQSNGPLPQVLACKWLASNKCCHNWFFPKKLNYSIKEIS